MQKRFWVSWLKCLLLVWVAGSACAAMAKTDAVATLLAKHASLEEQLRQNQFKRPLVLDSAELPDRLKGDIYAVVDHPFGTVTAALNDPNHWCDVMLLHINVKYCHAMEGQPGTRLRVNIGKKTSELLINVARVEFNYGVAAATPQYLEIVLNAKDGPMGTSDYLIRLEAVALPNAKTFLHLTYSYAVNFAARLAMQTYLGTVARSKVGFTVTGKGADGRPQHIGGVRGVMERNTMRYYLAIDTFLGAAGAPLATRVEKRLQDWFSATEQYPRQLHEMDRGQYVDMKRAEHLRQQTVR
ncbi:MAG: hypothetical protein Q7T10_07460 [Rhodoferax sp.]|uniref:hypothetical protein n=1 Tax=Rhodoferax sp. TaxID=50421 RepID=UPI0027252882|nr:hypothetical protein [Rhodoferax sp.]MDO8448629.1 hypothetical protein [Rhodoferax sp.]